ncbi:Protein of unknown function (DUF1415) [Seminavis robusta]|uniref:DUF1415 domain-containing protein n=1 Tax=Seminavis robusta TaxID=568900 RepID=A0A9N8EGK3_9STRA|nr:Protein of unknown function (DUF1415) [Seminavis robusta]|eukprot:Sro1063_g237120.1 Protein of unknown function (DUF1415) (242) ;mRNA; r:24395-25120
MIPLIISSRVVAKPSQILRRLPHLIQRRNHGGVASSPANRNDKELSTKKWVESIVIGEKLCPFAAPLLKEEGLLRIVVSSATNTDEAVKDVQREVQDLVGTDSRTASSSRTHETTLLVFDKDTFVKDYLDFVRLSWTLQELAVEEYQLQDKLQLVLFHPQATHQTYAVFDGEDDDLESPGDYTIRSPYPTVHLLREEDVLRAVKSGYPDLEYLPSRNKAKLLGQGIEACRHRLQQCYHVVN